MPGPTRRQRGHDAESRVDRAARDRGWQRVARNYFCRGGELDLVYTLNDHLIVVEVRYRAHNSHGRAVATVGRGKQRRIILATRHFLARHPQYADLAVRFDVVGLNAAGDLEWVDNAFYAE